MQTTTCWETSTAPPARSLPPARPGGVALAIARGSNLTMARDKMKSASLHSFHETHTEPTEVRIPFQTLVHEILEQIGEDPTREGLRQTPARVEASLKWLTRGYGMNVDEVIGNALFEETHESMICVRDIEIYSMCEHHMLPFFGRAHVAYLPNGRIVGLSKIPRVVEVFARRLQVQVRLARTVREVTFERRTDIPCYLTDPASVERAVGRVEQEPGLPDIIVNNAGVFFIKPLAETTYEDFTRTLATNLTAAFLIARALVPKMVKRGSGHLVTIGSISDYIGFSGSTAYAASKFGLRGMHEVIRQETAKSGVRTTLISPGPVDTDIWNAVDPDSKPGFTKRKDMMRAEDIAAAVLYAVMQPERIDITEIRLLPTLYTPRG